MPALTAAPRVDHHRFAPEDGVAHPAGEPRARVRRVAAPAGQCGGIDRPVRRRVDDAEVGRLPRRDRAALGAATVRVEPGERSGLPAEQSEEPLDRQVELAPAPGASAVSSPSMPGGASSKGASLRSGACGAWSVAIGVDGAVGAGRP